MVEIDLLECTVRRCGVLMQLAVRLVCLVSLLQQQSACLHGVVSCVGLWATTYMTEIPIYQVEIKHGHVCRLPLSVNRAARLFVGHGRDACVCSRYTAVSIAASSSRCACESI